MAFSSKAAIAEVGGPASLPADEDADFLDGFERWIEPEESADEKVSDEAIEVLRQRQDFFQSLAERVLALVGSD